MERRTKGHEELNRGERMGLMRRRVIRPTAQRGHGVTGSVGGHVKFWGVNFSGLVHKNQAATA